MHTIYIANEDNARLRMMLLLTPYNPRLKYEVTLLRSELDRAIIVPAESLPAATIRIGSSFVCEDLASGAREVCTLCLPHDGEAVDNGLSVLSRLGIAVLGRTVGAIVAWAGMPSAQQTLIRSVTPTTRVQRRRLTPPRRRSATRAAVAT